MNIATLPLLLKAVSKLDFKPIISKLKEIKIFDDNASLKDLDKEKMGQLMLEAITEITPQLAKVADDLPPIIAAFKGISVDEANKLDCFEALKEIISDSGIKGFFSRLLSPKSA